MIERESLTHGTPWVTSKLGDLCKMKSGGTPKSSVSEYYNGTIPFLTIRDMTNQGKHVKTTEKYITQDAVNSCSTWVVPSNTLIYSTYGSIGFVSYIDVPCAINQAVMALTDLKIDSEYLYHYLKTLKDTPYLESKIIGGAIRHINGNILKDFDISYPEDIEEQKKIAQVLSDLDELSKLHSLKVDELSKMKEHLMDNKSGIIENERNKQENNEWITVKLKDVFDIKAGGDIDKTRVVSDKDEEHPYPVYANALTNNGLFGYTDTYKYSGELVTVTGRGDIGHAVYRNEEFYPIVRLLILTPKVDWIDSKFISYMINTVKFTSESTGVPQLTTKTIGDISLTIPKSVSEQKRIAKMLSEYDSMVASQEQLISIIQREREFMRQAPQTIIRVLSGEQLD